MLLLLLLLVLFQVSRVVAIATFFLATLAAATTLGEAFAIYAFVVEAVTIDDAVADFSGGFIH